MQKTHQNKPNSLRLFFMLQHAVTLSRWRNPCFTNNFSMHLKTRLPFTLESLLCRVSTFSLLTGIGFAQTENLQKFPLSPVGFGIAEVQVQARRFLPIFSCLAKRHDLFIPKQKFEKKLIEPRPGDNGGLTSKHQALKSNIPQICRSSGEIVYKGDSLIKPHFEMTSAIICAEICR